MSSPTKVFIYISIFSQQNCETIQISYDQNILLHMQKQSPRDDFIKKGILAQVFSCEVCESFKSTFFNRTPLVAASAHDKFLVRFFRKELFFLPQNLFIYYFNVSKLSFNLQFFIFYLKCFSFYSLVFGSLTQFFIFLISTVNILKVS